ncbi:MAG: hypothetical protein ACK5C5_08805 [Bacteroidota bacterium]|jgi:L-rhamnose mutarotase
MPVFFLIIAIFFSHISMGQSSGTLRVASPEAVALRKANEKVLTTDSLSRLEILLKSYADSMARGSSDQVRKAYCALFNPLLLDILQTNLSYDYPFDSLKALSKLRSPDGQIRVYSWFLQSRENGTFEYFGLVQKKNKSTGEIKSIGLIEKKWETDMAEINQLKVDEWYGAVYYDIIERKIDKKTVYFLLGWHGRDRASTRKLIEVLSFDAWDNIDLGLPVFSGQPGAKTKYRVVFEFSATVVMLLRYEASKKMIVFDHLSPSSPALKGQYSSYGPDFTYDGYFFKKGKWIYKSNLDLKN